MTPVTILDATADPNLFGRWFRDRATWASWFAFLATLFGLPMTAEQQATYRECTKRTAAPVSAFSEAWLVCGRRAGKSFMLALIAVFLACFRDYRPLLAPGERATVVVIAADRRQARVILRYMRSLLTDVALLQPMVDRETAEAFDLSNGVSIEVAAASYRTTRGYTLAAALCDELAFWPSDDAAEPDYAVLDALRPGLATVPGAMLLCASSPYSRRGALWDAWKRFHGRDDASVLVWQAATRTMNPTVPERVVAEALERDPASASAEWLAQFRSDVAAFVDREVLDALVPLRVFERAPLPECRYVAFVDPSGGSSDSFTLAIGHDEDGRAVLDCVRETRAPFSPESAVSEFAETLKAYGVLEVHGDRYAGSWPADAFRKHGIEYWPSEKPKSGLYVDLLPRLNSGGVDLLDNKRLINQLAGLERRTARGGRESIDHAPGGHDDLANVVAGVVSELARTLRHGYGGYSAPIIVGPWDDWPDSEPVGKWWQ